MYFAVNNMATTTPIYDNNGNTSSQAPNDDQSDTPRDTMSFSSDWQATLPGKYIIWDPRTLS